MKHWMELPDHICIPMVYENPLATGEEGQSRSEWSTGSVIAYYETHMRKMMNRPEQYLKQQQKGEMPEIAVCDYIAGIDG